MALDALGKLAILADAAKYDASCASSGAVKRTSAKTGGIGSTESSGICHSYAPDGRCISLLKILMTNYCMFDCAYCINRISSNVRRARLTVKEIVDLTLDFYKRNYIEGLFLSSGIIRSPNYTMEMLAEVGRCLREDHQFAGYIHLKSIPDADQEIIDLAGKYADRLSINIELPTEASLKSFAPEKDMRAITHTMGELRSRIHTSAMERKESRRAPRFAPSGQSTQMIVGADATKDAAIIRTSTSLYKDYQLKRVYYSAFSPIPDASPVLPLVNPPLIREHRLYQADWLLRFYGFTVDEIVSGTSNGMFSLEIDPKLSWALKHRAMFPVDVNKAPKEMLLRVPGFGVRAVLKMLQTRRWHSLRYEDVARLSSAVKKAMPFFCALDWQPRGLTDSAGLLKKMQPKPRQLELFGS